MVDCGGRVFEHQQTELFLILLFVCCLLSSAVVCLLLSAVLCSLCLSVDVCSFYVFYFLTPPQILRKKQAKKN